MKKFQPAPERLASARRRLKAFCQWIRQLVSISVWVRQRFSYTGRRQSWNDRCPSMSIFRIGGPDTLERRLRHPDGVRGSLDRVSQGKHLDPLPFPCVGALVTDL